MISVIIPTYQEEKRIVSLVEHLQLYGGTNLKEIIVSDGGSSDHTVELAYEAGAKTIVNNKVNRASQLNFGVSQASGDILYFVHADTFPPTNFVQEILNEFNNGYQAGNFASRFSSDKKLLKINHFLDNFNVLFFRGGGDHSLYVHKNTFDSTGGYNEKFVIMEDFDMVKRLKSTTKFAFIKSNITVSDRKYKNNSYFKVAFAYSFTYLLFLLKLSPIKLLKIYRYLICKQRYYLPASKRKKSVQAVESYCHKVSLSK